jgi:acyl-homoserine lactone acylase PvdQ
MRKALCALLLLGVAVPSIGASAQTTIVQPYGTHDGAVTALNILPPGQGRYMNGAELTAAQAGGPQPPHNTDQMDLYSSLVQATPGLAASDLSKFFKDATFGVKPDDVESEESPKDGVTIVRDKGFGVPHVYGTTRSDVMYGAGYASAEDRLFMMDTLRYVGRGRTSEFLGASEANLAMDRAAYATSGYSEEELQGMIDRVKGLDPKLGPVAFQDVEDYTAGVNQYIDEALADPSKLPGEYEALQQQPTPWKPTDTVAVASLIGSQLGVGGGGELGNAAFYNSLLKEGKPAKEAGRIFDDLREAEDPEAPTTTAKRFPWNNDLGPIDPKSVAMPDRPKQASKQQQRLITLPRYIDGPFGRINIAFPSAMSNAVLVGAKHSKSGRPIAVMGPQTAYWSPEILMELDLHGPGIDARGVGFPGISQYVLLGRGRDYAWSATSAGGDQVDIFAEELCNPDGGEVDPDGTFYLKGKKCTEMYTRTDSWFAKPSAGGPPPVPPGSENVMVEMTTQRTDNGIVQARGTVDGKPVAFVAQRASFMAEVDSALTYVDLMNADKINSAEDFQKAFGRFAFTFNWFYVDDKDIAYQLGGYHPLRARGTDPDFPVWGNGKWDWRGNLSFADTPKDKSPSSGYIVSWNNKQAPGFRSNDQNWAYGSIYRSQLLSDPVQRAIKAGKKLGLVDLVNIMGDAATRDLRGYRVLPWMLKVLGKQKDERIAGALKLLRDWMASGANREATEAGGDYEHSSAIALMDAWWEPAIEAIFRPRLGDAFTDIPQIFDNKPGHLGSAYQGGFYGQVQKDLRGVLGKRVRGRYSYGYCGKGKLAACRKVLLESLDKAIESLEDAFGADPATWDVDEAADAIQFTAVGVQGQDPMQWQNRPTFQQVLEFKASD